MCVVKELWIQATEIYNLPLTIGLIFFCAYWVISSIGIFDFDTDVDIEVDTDLDVEGGGGVSVFNGILNFVNATDVPLMLVLTIINTVMWMIAMATNHVLNPNNVSLVAFGLLVGNFIISVIVARYITKPLAPLFKSLTDDVEKALPLVGQTGKVKSRVLDHNYGQVEIPRDKNAPALINCKLSESDSALVRGADVLVVKFDQDSQHYIVRSIEAQTNSTISTIQASTLPKSEESSADQQEHLTTKKEN